MRIVPKSALIVLVFLLASPIVMACDCFKPEVAQGFEIARAVFQGEVTEIIPPRNSAKDAPFTERAWTIRFKVERTWKGPFLIEADVYAFMGGCFSPPWLVKGENISFADPVRDSIKSTDVMISACNRTTSMSATRTEFRFFRPPLDQSAESDIRALNALMAMPGPKPRPDAFPKMNFLEP
jgi:hypothetical protein